MKCKICKKERREYSDGLCFFCYRKTYGFDAVCKSCGATFKAKSSRNWYCDDCKKEVRRRIDVADKVCKKCGKARSENKIKSDGICCYCHQQNTREKQNLAKYGVPAYMQTDEFKRKSRQTCIELYGTERYQQSTLGRERQKNRHASNRSVIWNDATAKFINDKQYCLSILKSFDHKPTYNEVQDKLGIHTQYIPRAIRKFGLRNMIDLQYHKGHSIAEDGVRSYVQSFGFTAEPNRGLLHGKELDIYVPEAKIAIEYDGMYWHKESIAGKSKQLDKTKACEAKGVRLIHIFEWDWLYRKEQCKALLQSALHCNTTIGANKCKTAIISKNDYDCFIASNCIYENADSSKYIGLLYNGEIVAVMSFCMSKWYKGKTELLMYCSKLGLTIQGGMSKLFKYGVSLFSFTDVVAKCDASKFDGNVFSMLGFDFIEWTKPGYTWCDNAGDIVSQYEAKNKYTNGDMTKAGYWRVFDCGNKVYEWHK